MKNDYCKAHGLERILDLVDDSEPFNVAVKATYSDCSNSNCNSRSVFSIEEADL